MDQLTDISESQGLLRDEVNLGLCVGWGKSGKEGCLASALGQWEVPGAFTDAHLWYGLPQGEETLKPFVLGLG